MSLAETPLGASWNGSVILDIGGDVGALILHAPSELFGDEITVLPDDRSIPHTHSAVRERRAPEGSRYAAVYPQLAAGRYTVDGSRQRFEIVGGRVTQLDVADYSAPRHPHH